MERILILQHSKVAGDSVRVTLRGELVNAKTFNALFLHSECKLIHPKYFGAHNVNANKCIVIIIIPEVATCLHDIVQIECNNIMKEMQ